MRSMFRIPCTWAQALHLAIAWGVILGLLAAVGVEVWRYANGG